MTTLIVVSLGLIGFVAFSAIIFALAELMAEGEDYASPLKDDPTWYGGRHRLTGRHVSAEHEHTSLASINKHSEHRFADLMDEPIPAVRSPFPESPLFTELGH